MALSPRTWLFAACLALGPLALWGAGSVVHANEFIDCNPPLDTLGKFVQCKFPYVPGGAALPTDYCFHAEGDRGYNWWPYVDAGGKLQFSRVRHAVRIPVRYVIGGVQKGSSIFVGFDFAGDNGGLPTLARAPAQQSGLVTPPPITCDLAQLIRTALLDGVQIAESADFTTLAPVDEVDYRWWYFRGQPHSVFRIFLIPAKFTILDKAGVKSTEVMGIIVVSYGGGAGP